MTKMLKKKLGLWSVVAAFSAVSIAQANNVESYGGAVVDVAAPSDLEAQETSESVAETVTQPSGGSGLILSAESRPSYMPNNGGTIGLNEGHTENNVILGYKFNPTTSLMVRQEFNTNLFTPGTSGVGLAAQDLIVIGKFDNIWADASSGLAFSYEPRIYLPTEAGERAKGMLGATRQYLKLTKVFNDVFSMTAMETPILFAYNSAGSVDEKGVPSANRLFENRVYVIADINFTKELSLSLPIILNNTYHSNTGNAAAFSNSWKAKLWTYPELNYAFNSNFSLGLAFQSDNFLSYDDNGVYQGASFVDGIQNGMYQAIVTISL